MADVTLLVGDGGAWKGWTGVTVHKSLEAVAHSFELELTDRTPRQPALRLGPGLTCALGMDGQIALSGYLDEVSQDYGRDAHTVRITGRSPAGDFVDCDCVPPWEYAGLTLTEVVTRLIAPFGPSVVTETDVGEPFERFTINPGDTVWSVIERGCRLRGVLAITDPVDGLNLVLTRAGCGGAAPVGLRLGVNILKGAGRRSWAGRFSQYLALGQQENRDRVSAAQAAGPSATLSDGEINRYRPKVLVAEGQGDGVTLRERAAWQRAVAKAKSERLSYSVQGWTAGPGGPLWRPNWMVEVTDDFLGVSGTRLIAAVTLTLDRSQGSLTTLELVPPDAYLPAPGGQES